jgi:hypothetical protein
MANQPTLYELSGSGIHVSYSTSSFQGGPLFTYHDALQFKSVSGDQIKTEQTAIGTVVTIVLHMTVDRGSTTFSLLLPRVNLPAPPASQTANITAEGITTLQRFSVPPPLGQTQLYTVRTLHGTASFVVA